MTWEDHPKHQKQQVRLIGILSVLLLVACAAILWQRSGTPGTTDIRLSGVAGTAFTGYIICSGRRTDESSDLPHWVHLNGITEFEYRKVHSDDKVTFEAHYYEGRAKEAAQSIVIVLAPGILGIRGHIQGHGFSVESFTP
jgi:hypothetical protein